MKLPLIKRIIDGLHIPNADPHIILDLVGLPLAAWPEALAKPSWSWIKKSQPMMRTPDGRNAHVAKILYAAMGFQIHEKATLRYFISPKPAIPDVNPAHWHPGIIPKKMSLKRAHKLFHQKIDFNPHDVIEHEANIPDHHQAMVIPEATFELTRQFRPEAYAEDPYEYEISEIIELAEEYNLPLNQFLREVEDNPDWTQDMVQEAYRRLGWT